MRAEEFITEITAGTIQVGDWTILISDHVYDRADDRIKSNYASIDSALKKVPAITGQLSKLDVNSLAWAYDEETNISIGLRKRSGNTVLLGTVVKGRAFGRPDVIDITLPKTAPSAQIRGSVVDVGKRMGRIDPTVKPAFRAPGHMPDHSNDHAPHNELKIKPLKIVPDMLK